MALRVSSRFGCAKHPEGKPKAILKRLDARFDFQNRIANRRETIAFVCLGEELAFDHASPVGEREKFHWLPRDLMMRALFDDQAACRDRLADELDEAVYRAIGIPSHIIKKFERMATDRKAE